MNAVSLDDVPLVSLFYFSLQLGTDLIVYQSACSRRALSPPFAFHVTVPNDIALVFLEKERTCQ